MCAKKLVLPGILVKQVQSEQGAWHDYEFKVAKDSPANPFFYTNLELQKVLGENQQLMGKPIGYITYSKSVREPNAFEVTIGPFDLVDKRIFQGKGASNALWKICQTNFMKHEGNAVVIPSGQTMSEELAARVAKMRFRVVGNTFREKSQNVLNELRSRKRAFYSQKRK